MHPNTKKKLILGLNYGLSQQAMQRMIDTSPQPAMKTKPGLEPPPKSPVELSTLFPSPRAGQSQSSSASPE